MSKKTAALTDFDKQLIAGMEEVVAHIHGEPNKGRATVVEFADAKAIREGLGMSQAVFSALTESRSRPCSTGSSADITQTARHPPTSGRLRSSPSKSAKCSSVTGCSSRPRSSSGRGDKAEMRSAEAGHMMGASGPGHRGSVAITARQFGRGLRPGLPPRPPVRPSQRRLRPARGDRSESDSPIQRRPVSVRARSPADRPGADPRSGPDPSRGDVGRRPGRIGRPNGPDRSIDETTWIAQSASRYSDVPLSLPWIAQSASRYSDVRIVPLGTRGQNT